MGFIYAIIGRTEEAVDAFHKALGIRRDDTFSTTMLTYVIEQHAEDTVPFTGIINIFLSERIVQYKIRERKVKTLNPKLKRSL